VTLEVQDLQAERLGPVSLQVRAGEVVGLAGLMGSGRSRLLHVLFGAIPATGGSVRLAGRPYAPRGPADAVEAGIGMVPEDRKLQSLIPDAPIRWNVTLAVLRRLCVWKFVLGIRKEKRTASELTRQARVLCRTIEQPVRSLSGGNQQRAIFARWLATSPRLLLLDEPTRGVDVGAKAEIYRIIDEARAAGMAVLAVSSELEELLATSMRIIVLRNGRVNDELTHGEFSKERIMMAATGTGGSR
jgi:ABC-type sugar transport system ATPase subunit